MAARSPGKNRGQNTALTPFRFYPLERVLNRNRAQAIGLLGADGYVTVLLDRIGQYQGKIAQQSGAEGTN